MGYRPTKCGLRIAVSKAHWAFSLGIRSGVFVLVLVIVIDDIDPPILAQPQRL